MTTYHNLVHAPVNASYVLPARPSGQSLLVTKPVDADPSPLIAGAAARGLGRRFSTQAQSLEILLSEVRERLARLDGLLVEGSRAQLKDAVRDVENVVDWCDALQAGLASETDKAAQGLEPIDLVDLCQQQAASMQSVDDPITVAAKDHVTYWGDQAKLVNLIQNGLTLVSERTGGLGLRCVEVAAIRGATLVRIFSRGEPQGDLDPDVVDLFRRAVEKVGATVVPDELGPGGAGLVLRLPG